ncbi:hypothetical protein CK203_072971 [Vitis vinifera]|uniref:Uncharacterized protein n=1 Tax=Vitis vinifera TaxID=29760 RepID=A0A438F231_VITVI|nr:hypothetical protein CK203_072971 [Vitis vinifera]
MICIVNNYNQGYFIAACLLCSCMQRAKYDIGEEAVHRFSLSPEDRATLELAEWVDGTFRRASVEDAVSRAADGTSAVQDLDFSSLRSQLGPLAAILLCIDVAATSVRSADMSLQLLNQISFIGWPVKVAQLVRANATLCGRGTWF